MSLVGGESVEAALAQEEPEAPAAVVEGSDVPGGVVQAVAPSINGVQERGDLSVGSARETSAVLKMKGLGTCRMLLDVACYVPCWAERAGNCQCSTTTRSFRSLHPGLPYNTSQEQILDFFSGFAVKNISFVGEPDGRPSGLVREKLILCALASLKSLSQYLFHFTLNAPHAAALCRPLPSLRAKKRP
eukprot:997062-Pelagomonas_calceolata.AAC.2